MTNDTRDEILKNAIDYYGEFTQHSVAQEECGELIQAISKWLRAVKPTDQLNARNLIRDEMADVLVMLEQLKLMHSISDKELNQQIDYKLVRLRGRMDDGE